MYAIITFIGDEGDIHVQSNLSPKMVEANLSRSITPDDNVFLLNAFKTWLSSDQSSPMFGSDFNDRAFYIRKVTQ